MRKSTFLAFLAVALAPALMVQTGWGQGQQGQGQGQGQPARAGGGGGGFGQLPTPVPVDQEYLEWPLPAGDEQYGSIDGHRMLKYTQDLSDIAERYHAAGHQFWGRITGTEADAEARQYLTEHLKAAGITDIREQVIDLSPQWLPQSWEVDVTGGGKTIKLDTAQPSMSTPGTGPEGVDLEAVYVGTGSDADYIGRDVKGKAVFVYSATHSHQQNTENTEHLSNRAEQKGAAAVFIIQTLPGNVRWQFYNRGTKIPTFATGLEDGMAVRTMIGQLGAAAAPHVKLRMDVQMVPNLKTGTIWATLPGMTDEKIFLFAHRDGYFSGAVDNGTGMASLLELAQFYAKMPKEKRRRTIVFVSTSGHHSNGDNGQPHVTVSADWIYHHLDEVFGKNTALVINLEHTATTEVGYFLPQPPIRSANSTEAPMFWYVHGAPKLEQLMFADFREFGVPLYDQPDRAAYGEIQDFAPYYTSLQTIDFGVFSHTDHEDMSMVPWTGLEATTRAYAKIIDDVNKLDVKDIAPPPAGPPPARTVNGNEPR